MITLLLELSLLLEVVAAPGLRLLHETQSLFVVLPRSAQITSRLSTKLWAEALPTAPGLGHSLRIFSWKQVFMLLK